MYPDASARFLASLRRSGKRKTVVDFYFRDKLILADVGVTTGSITCDRTNIIRRSGTLTVTEPDALNLLKDVRSFYGLEIRPRSGVVFNRMTEELIPMGVFTVETVQPTQKSGLKSADLTFYDRAKAVDRAGFIRPRDYGGLSTQYVINDLVSELGYTVDFADGTPDSYMPGGSVFGGDQGGAGGRMQTVQDLCARLGSELYFDYNGLPKVVPVPSVSGGANPLTADWNIDAGENGVMIDACPLTTREGVVNVVTVFGTSPGDSAPAPWASVADTNPRSPSRFGGPAGICSYRIDSHPATTEFECYQVAQTELINRAGLPRSIAWEALVNPCLWSGDTVAFTFPDHAVEVHILDTVVTPLGVDSQTGTTRAVQYVG